MTIKIISEHVLDRILSPSPVLNPLHQNQVHYGGKLFSRPTFRKVINKKNSSTTLKASVGFILAELTFNLLFSGCNEFTDNNNKIIIIK